MNIVLIIFALSLDSAAVNPSDIKGLLKWNLVEADLRLSPPTSDRGWGARYQLLEFNYTFVKHRIGFGTSLLESWGYEFSGDFHYSILPVEIKILIWYDERGFFDSPFIPMFNGYCHINFIPILPAYGSDIAVDVGLEYTPGLLLNFRTGYYIIPRTNNSALYISAGLFLGAVHRIR